MFLHGFGADLNGWRPVHRLLPETRPALAIDLPGHGLSPLGEDASFEALVEAARGALIEEGVSAAHLVGHSLGGAVAAALAHKPGVKALSLMLIAPAGLGDEVNAAFFDGLSAGRHRGRPDALAPYARGRSRGARLRARQDHAAPAQGAAAGRGATAVGRRPCSPAADRRSTSAAISPRSQAPTKIVVGVEDRITPARHAEGLSGLIALHRFPRVGHMPHLEARREVASLIEELARTARPA